MVHRLEVLKTLLAAAAVATVLILVLHSAYPNMEPKTSYGTTTEQKGSSPIISADASTNDDRAEPALNMTDHVNKPLIRNCTGYYELRSINFNDKAIKSRLCEDFEAYTKVDGRYPLCRLSSRLPRVIQDEVFSQAIKTYMTSRITGNTITVFGYNGYEAVTEEIKSRHTWEGQMTTGIVKIMQTLPKGSVTFLDVGSNIGAYSLMAADAGFPTVAVDANIRNLVRIQFAVRDMGWPSDRLRVIWSFFHPEIGLPSIDFDIQHDCNVGGALAGSFTKILLKDTVPVMTASADDLLSQLLTPLVVMKIDIELSERIFFENSQRFLIEKNVVVVQMEWRRSDIRNPVVSSPHHRFLVNYFLSRNYVLLSPNTLNSLDPETFREIDTLWVKAAYVETVRMSLRM